MTTTQAPLAAPAGSAAPADRAGRHVGTGSIRQPQSSERIRRRHYLVGLTKRLLPVVALAMLCSIALWPEITRDAERAG